MLVAVSLLTLQRGLDIEIQFKLTLFIDDILENVFKFMESKRDALPQTTMNS